jgi:hypothetical protein
MFRCSKSVLRYVHLQEGSDTRWVHPRIYDWPNEGSTSPAAALPILNWNAGRASDVVVEVLDEWKKITSSLTFLLARLFTRDAPHGKKGGVFHPVMFSPPLFV